MAIQAYVLVDITAKRPSAVVSRLTKLKGVVSAQAVTGPHDAIVLVNADDMTQLGQLVMEQIRGIEGVGRTLTCVVAD
ncbi:MAG: Lrp/AsnC ligand binding domain-containing protein [Candidatus Tectomicrobia bacterium]|nr:Lrp/AsnC ligand binding domain-containing protein [Candidatus Tectomicrobia bacterium]